MRCARLRASSCAALGSDGESDGEFALRSRLAMANAHSTCGRISFTTKGGRTCMFLATCGGASRASVARSSQHRHRCMPEDCAHRGGLSRCTVHVALVDCAKASAGAQARRARRVTRRLPNNRLCMSLWRTNRNVGSGSSCETLERQRLRHFARCEEVRFGIHEAATRGSWGDLSFLEHLILLVLSHSFSLSLSLLSVSLPPQ